MRLLDLADLHPAYPGTVGSSGRVYSTLSSAFLNASTLMSSKFQMDCGSALKSLGPFTAKLPSRSVAILTGQRVLLRIGKLQ